MFGLLLSVDEFLIPVALVLLLLSFWLRLLFGLTGVAQAATTGAKAGETNSNKLPQTGEKKGMLLSIIGLLAAALGIFGIAINRKKEN